MDPPLEGLPIVRELIIFGLYLFHIDSTDGAVEVAQEGLDNMKGAHDDCMIIPADKEG